MWFFSFSEPLLTRLTLSLRWRMAHAFPLQTEHSLVKSRHCLAECQTNKTPKAYFNSQRALSVKLQVHKRICEGHFTWKSSTEHLKWSSSRITSYTSRGAAGSKSCAVGKCSTKIPGRMHARLHALLAYPAAFDISICSFYYACASGSYMRLESHSSFLVKGASREARKAFFYIIHCKIHICSFPAAPSSTVLS